MKKWPQIAENGARMIVPTNPDLADMLGRTDLNFEIVSFFDFWDPRFLDLGPQISKFLDFQVSDFQVPRCPGSQCCRALHQPVVLLHHEVHTFQMRVE